MKKYIFYISITIFLFTACKTRKEINMLCPGTFEFIYNKGKESREELILKGDSTFILTSFTYIQPPTCNGNWSIINKDTLLINCNPEKDTFAYFVTGYMELRTRKIKIINNNKLKMPITNNDKRKYVILQRVKLK